MSESRLFGSVVRALVSYRGDPGSIPSKGTGNFSATLHFVTAVMSLDGGSSGIGPLFRLKWLSVIINDDSFDEGECYGPDTRTFIST